MIKAKTQKCKNCGNEFSGIFCNNCGQKLINKRFTVKEIVMSSFSTTFSINKGFFYTAKMLFVNPAKVIDDYINGKTKYYINPLKYLLIIAGINAFLSIYFNVFDMQQDAVYESMTTSEKTDFYLSFREKLKSILSFLVLFILPFISFSSYLLHKRSKYYYAEHLIINSYLFAQITLIGIFFFPITLISSDLMGIQMFFNIIVMIFLYSYFNKIFFKISIFRSIFKSAITIVFGFFLFTIFMLIIMILLNVTFNFLQ